MLDENSVLLLVAFISSLGKGKPYIVLNTVNSSSISNKKIVVHPKLLIFGVAI